MSLTPGSRIGPYEIGAQIGVGGMGEVYRATDTNLARQVAIKALPASMAADAERLARFDREAKTLAALNHPNIAAIYGLERSDGQTALVMELVEGPTLAERIAEGPIPIDDVLAIAKQIAEALEAAHEQGIVHRDLKPANVKVRPDGTVKVLDFGLAKVLEPTSTAGVDITASPTITSPAMTGVGIILGTASYMSPEQARSKAVDKRADIWAFGCVLFEMLTRRRAFVGHDVSETLASVLKSEPEWTALPATTPPAVRSLLRRCLQKDSERRLRDIADARFQIEDSLGEPARPPTAPRGKSHERIAWVAGLIAVATAAAGSTLYLAPPRADVDEEVRFEITTPPTADPTAFAISPDGKKIVFEATFDGTSRLWLRVLDAVSVRPLGGTEGATRPFWSADSRSVGYSVNGQVNAVDVETGTSQRLGHAGAWNQDGTVLFNRGGGNPIYRAPAIGGEPTEVTPVLPGSDQVAPQFLPDGRHFLFTATGGSAPGTYTALLGSSEPPRRIVDNAVVATYSTDHLLFIREGTLFAQPFDPTRLQLTGTVSTIADQIVTTSGRSFALSASAAGPIAFRTGPPAQAQFVWFDRSGARLQSIAGSDTASFFNSSLSPDGRYLAIGRNIGGGAADIWLLDLRRGVPDRFTRDPAFDLAPVWSPDGLRIAYGSNKKGTFDLYVKSADGTGTEDLLAGDEIGGPSDWSRDGRFILAAREVGPEVDIWAVPVEGDGKPFPVVETKTSQESNGQFSPDGKWIAFQSNESGRREIYLQPFPGPGRKTRISNEGGVQPRWRNDGKELFYLAPDDRLMAVPVKLNSDSGTVDTGTPVSLFAAHLPALPSTTLHAQHYTVSEDGQRFLVQTAKEVTLPIIVILNLKRRS